jgi:translation initiation factor IF-2
MRLPTLRVREAEERKIAEEEARRRASRASVDRHEREAADARKREEEERHKREEETKRKAGEVAKKRLGDDETRRLGGPGGRMALEAEDDEAPRSRRPGSAGRPVAAPRPTPRAGGEKQRGRLTLVTALRADEVRERSVASFRRRTQRLKGVASSEPKEKLVREVTIPEAITIQDLANRMSERAVDVIRLLMKQGQMATINDVIDADTAQLIAEEMGQACVRLADAEEGLFDIATILRRSNRARPLSPSWAMSITAKRRCSTRSARRKSLPAKPAALRSISAPIRSPRRREPR